MDLSAESKRFLIYTAADKRIDIFKRTATDEQDVRRVDLDHRLLWMFPTAFRRNTRDRPLKDFEERLLHTLA